MNKILVTLIVMMIRRYQKVAPYSLRACCRYEPSCSEFMIMAVQKYGFVSGVWKGIARIFRCRQPYGGVNYP
jgi:putative membrane protein insertion efficiency factor